MVVDNKDEGIFPETTSKWKRIIRDGEFPDLTPFSVHKASVATTSSSDAHPLLAAVANTTPAQLQVFGPGSNFSQTSGFSSFLSGSYSGSKTRMYPRSEQKTPS